MSGDGFHEVSDQPDGGRGAIGQVAHGFLNATRASQDLPMIALAYNTMPDPPGPSGYTEFETATQYWEAAGRDAHRYIAMLTSALQAWPPIDTEEPDAPGEASTPTRLDGMAMVFAAAAVRGDAGPAGAALAANIAEGYYRHGDVAASPTSRRALMVVAVSRAGDTALMSLAPGEISPVSEMTQDLVVGGALIQALADLLAAFWTRIEAMERAQQGDA